MSGTQSNTEPIIDSLAIVGKGRFSISADGSILAKEAVFNCEIDENVYTIEAYHYPWHKMRETMPIANIKRIFLGDEVHLVWADCPALDTIVTFDQSVFHGCPRTYEKLELKALDKSRIHFREGARITQSVKAKARGESLIQVPELSPSIKGKISEKHNARALFMGDPPSRNERVLLF